ncbi:MAG: hypothetical protein WC557_11595 [Ignavibacteriaceae bacterium]
MKKILLIILVSASLTGFAQFKDKNIFKPSIQEGMINNNAPALLLGFINPENFSMSHSYSMSYTTSGSNGLALGVYTNSMRYKFADNFNVQVDASLVHSPYSSFGKNYQNQLSGIYLSSAQLNYQPWKDFNISFQYRNIPGGMYNDFYGHNRFGGGLYENFLFGR